MRRGPQEDDSEQDHGSPTQGPGHRSPPDEHGHAPSGAAPDDVLRCAALENERVDEDVEEDRCQREARCKPVDNEAQPQHRGDAGDPGECERLAVTQFAGDQGPLAGAVHHPVDIAVDVAVERVGRAGTEAAADECREHEPEVRDAAGGENHHRCGCDEEQLDDARLGECDVRHHLAADADPPGRGSGLDGYIHDFDCRRPPGRRSLSRAVTRRQSGRDDSYT